MLATRHPADGSGGAIFISTMFMASAKQDELIARILRTHGRAHLLPEPRRLSLVVREYGTKILTAFVAILVGIVSGGLTQLAPGLSEAVKAAPLLSVPGQAAPRLSPPWDFSLSEC